MDSKRNYVIELLLEKADKLARQPALRLDFTEYDYIEEVKENALRFNELNKAIQILRDNIAPPPNWEEEKFLIFAGNTYRIEKIIYNSVICYGSKRVFDLDLCSVGKEKIYVINLIGRSTEVIGRLAPGKSVDLSPLGGDENFMLDANEIEYKYENTQDALYIYGAKIYEKGKWINDVEKHTNQNLSIRQLKQMID